LRGGNDGIHMVREADIADTIAFAENSRL